MARQVNSRLERDRLRPPRALRDRSSGAADRERDGDLWIGRASSIGWTGALAIVALALGSGLLRDVEDFSRLGYILYHGIWLGLYVLAVGLLFFQRRLGWVSWTLRSLPEISIVLIIALASCIWSPDPQLTFQRTVTLILTTTLGIYISA
jgi:hypothetical protein